MSVSQARTGIFGKGVSISDELMWRYIVLLTT